MYSYCAGLGATGGFGFAATGLGITGNCDERGPPSVSETGATSDVGDDGDVACERVSCITASGDFAAVGGDERGPKFSAASWMGLPSGRDSTGRGETLLLALALLLLLTLILLLLLVLLVLLLVAALLLVLVLSLPLLDDTDRGRGDP